jgi:uncharacterized membrane protein
MVRIAATEERVFTVEASPETVYDFFSQAEKLSQAMASVERCELLPGNRVRWVLQEKVDKGIRFKADYIATYEGDGSEHVSWRSLEGNMGNDGDVWIKPLASGGTEIRYRESVEPELPITPLMARLITPLVARELRGEISGFLEKVRVHLGLDDSSRGKQGVPSRRKMC